MGAYPSGAPVEALARYFEYWLLRLQGVYPEARGTLSAQAMEFLAASRTVAPDRLADVPVNRKTLTELEHSFKFSDAVLRHLIVKMAKAVTAPSPMMKEEKSKSLMERMERGPGAGDVANVPPAVVPAPAA